jgi:hypothetical protein
MDTPRQPPPVPKPAELPPDPPEMPKFLTRRSAIVMTIGFGVLLLIALTRIGGGSATISAKGLGPLEIGKSSRTAMQNFAKGPVSFWFKQRGNPPVRFKGELWQYQCIGGGTIFGASCRTLYGITNGHLATIETNSPQFYTTGIRIGTPLAQARREKRASWSGWQVKCPHLTLSSPRGVTFLALISKNASDPAGYVSGFYLSATPSSFAYCPA